MTALRHPIWALALTALLVLTGQGLAVARGMAPATQSAELCTGSGPVMVHLDANGQPTAPPHYCPDGALALLQLLALERPAPVFRAQVARMAQPLPDWRAPSRPQGPARARGPPVWM